jgi:hypothetical protein
MADSVSRLAVLIRQIQARLGSALQSGDPLPAMKFGTVSVSTAAAVSGSAVVTHDADFTPTRVFLTPNSNGVISANVTSITSTQFTVGIQYVDGVARTASNPVYWLATAF